MFACARNVLLVLAATLCAACAPLPMERYVPEAAGGRLFYVSCPYNKHIPDGIEFAFDDVKLFASIWPGDGRHYIQLRFDVPAGKVVQLHGDRIVLASSSGNILGEAKFDRVSLVDTPLWSDYYDSPALQQYRVAVNDPMVGKTAVFNGMLPMARHFWLAAYLEQTPPADLRITLPAFAINGNETEIPPILFRKETFLGFALINC